MIRTTGNIADFKPWYQKGSLYVIQWDMRPDKVHNQETGEVTESDTRASWMQEIFRYKPSENDIKRMMTERYNWETDNKILNGFVWKDMQVWLSNENQRNYESMYNLAVQGKPVLPTTFKFGTDYNPVYYTFETVEDLEDFYLNAVKYIESCYTECWRNKDSIDMTGYSELFN